MSTTGQTQRLEQRLAGRLKVDIYATRAEAGAEAASVVEEAINERLSSQDMVRVMFASAPSQLELLAALRASRRIAWSKVVAFHMDEYLDLPEGAEERFSTFLRRQLFDVVTPAAFYAIDPADPAAECRRYGALLREAPIDIVCCGIGENGHLAFNEPGESHFVDDEWLRVIPLTEVSRRQQVNDGCFTTLASVPLAAITVTVPVLVSARRIVGVVPGASKAAALARVMRGPITEECPATALRGHRAATLFVDRAACPDAR